MLRLDEDGLRTLISAFSGGLDTFVKLDDKELTQTPIHNGILMFKFPSPGPIGIYKKSDHKLMVFDKNFKKIRDFEDIKICLNKKIS